MTANVIDVARDSRKLDAPRAAIVQTKRMQQRAETRERLFEAAIAEFQRVGFADAQVGNIVATVGVARGTFYFHFPTKERVLVELQRRAEANITERLLTRNEVHEQGPALREFLRSVVHSILEEKAHLGPRLVRDALSMHTLIPVEPDWAGDTLFTIVAGYFHEAVAKGTVRRDLNPGEVAQVFLTSLFGFMLWTPDSFADQREALGRLVDIFVSGIAP